MNKIKDAKINYKSNDLTFEDGAPEKKDGSRTVFDIKKPCLYICKNNKMRWEYYLKHIDNKTQKEIDYPEMIIYDGAKTTTFTYWVATDIKKGSLVLGNKIVEIREGLERSGNDPFFTSFECVKEIFEDAKKEKGIVMKIEEDKNKKVFIVSMNIPGEEGSMKLWIDPAIGYLVNKIEEMPREGLLYITENIEVKSYGEDKIWIPTKSTFKMIKTKLNKCVYNVEFEVENAEFNTGIKDEYFNIDFPEGSHVVDRRTNKSYEFHKAGNKEDE